MAFASPTSVIEATAGVDDAESLCYWPLWRLTQALQTQALSAQTLLDACEAAFKRDHETVHALVIHDHAAARAEACRIDAARRAGEALGPLAGIPFSIKESFDVAGWPTTCGDSAHAHNIADQDAAVITRLRRAGAVLLGKSNVPLHLRDWQSHNAVYGTTRNPHAPTRTPGGSSGGSAAAVCAGMSVFDVGSDIGSSLRNPAHYCGIFSHKSTHGLISLAGHGIRSDDPTPDINVAGPLARSAKDLEILLRVLAQDGRELRAPRPVQLDHCRIGVLSSHPFAPVDSEVSTVIESLARRLEQSGAKVTMQSMPSIEAEELWRTYVLMLRAATSMYMNDSAYAQAQERARECDPHDLSYATLQHVGTVLDHRAWLQLAQARRRFARAWDDYFQWYDVLLCPAAATPAFELNQAGEPWQRMLSVNGRPQPMTTQLFWAGFSGLCGLPSTVAPAGLSTEGLPVGVQIIAGHGEDLTSLRVAQWLEDLGYCYRPPRMRRQ
ncbi:amidase [Bordetella sp. 02P26C-1]|uniref:amidase n=1 Tax=Bordetella sp. 02P26C-1 TaxID=2683195 RepID=UPI001354D37B|nr:amidase [Bordetella sp. 02P26C-1]